MLNRESQWIRLSVAPAKPEKPSSTGNTQVKRCAKNASPNPSKQRREQP